MYADDGAELEEMYRRAKATGVTTSLDTAAPDPNSPAGRADWPVILRRTLPFVDVFLPSFEELLFMLRRETLRPAGRRDRRAHFSRPRRPRCCTTSATSCSPWARRLSASSWGIGASTSALVQRSAWPTWAALVRPTSMQWADRELWAPCFKVQVVGTAGSGDCTIAGFLTALLRDLSPSDAATMAVAVGACNVEAADTLSGVRTWEETDRTRFAASGLARSRRQPRPRGWPRWRHSEPPAEAPLR